MTVLALLDPEPVSQLFPLTLLVLLVPDVPAGNAEPLAAAGVGVLWAVLMTMLAVGLVAVVVPTHALAPAERFVLRSPELLPGCLSLSLEPLSLCLGHRPDDAVGWAGLHGPLPAVIEDRTTRADGFRLRGLLLGPV